MLQKDFDELKNVIIDFYQITGIMLCLYDENFNLVYYYPQKHSPFCSIIRDIHLEHKCFECDQNAMRHCKQTKKPYIYECHMGLMEAMTPIISSDIIIGYLLMGQILSEHKTLQMKDKIESLPKATDDSKAALLAVLEKMKPLSKNTLEAAVHIMEMCASFISLKRFVFSEQNPLQREIENYIYEHLADSDLSMTTICNHFLISRSSLYTISKNAYGLGISDYIRYCRIEKAKKMLLHKQHSISEISRLCGFSEANYFTKTFKQLTGYLPKDFASSNAHKKTK